MRGSESNRTERIHIAGESFCCPEQSASRKRHIGHFIGRLILSCESRAHFRAVLVQRLFSVERKHCKSGGSSVTSSQRSSFQERRLSNRLATAACAFLVERTPLFFFVDARARTWLRPSSSRQRWAHPHVQPRRLNIETASKLERLHCGSSHFVLPGDAPRQSREHRARPCSRSAVRWRLCLAAR